MQPDTQPTVSLEDRFWRRFLIVVVATGILAVFFFVFESWYAEVQAKKAEEHTSFVEPTPLQWRGEGSIDQELQVFSTSPVILGNELNRAWQDWSTDTLLEKIPPTTPEEQAKFKIKHLSSYAELFLHHISFLEKKNLSAIELDIGGSVTSTDAIIIELVDENGKGLGGQPLLWYANSPISNAMDFQHITIPLVNLNAGEKIYGMRLERNGAGEIFLKNLAFTESNIVFPKAQFLSGGGVIDKDFKKLFPQYEITVFERYDDAVNWGIQYGGSLVFENRKIAGISLGNSKSLLALFVSGFNWSDYRFETRLDWSEIQGVSIYARYQSESDHVKCAFGGNGGYIAIYEVSGGREELRSYTYANVSPFESWKDVSIGVSVSGNKIECLKDGESVLRYQSNTVPKLGTIGIGLWNSSGGGGVGNKIEIKNISIHSIEEAIEN